MIHPKVVVLILSYDGKYLLEDSITSYMNNDYSNFEIVVIDNGSCDGTQKYVKKVFPSVKLLRINENKGYSGGFNYGLEMAFNKMQADYVLVTNNDVKADKKVINELVKIAQTDHKIGFVTGKVYYYSNPNILQTVGKSNDPIRWNGEHIGNREEDRGQYEQIRELHFADDIFTLVSKKLYDDVGGYDPEFFLEGEEYDWQARAKKLNYKIYYTPYAKIWHKDSMTIGEKSALKKYYDTRNPMLVILKHKSPDFFRKYFWNLIKVGIIKSTLVNFKNLQIWGGVNLWRGLISGLAWGIKNKKFTWNHFFISINNLFD